MKFYDRYTGKFTNILPHGIDLGRFAVVEGSEVRDLVNIDVISLGDYVISESLFVETNQNIHDLLQTIATSIDDCFMDVMPIIQQFNTEINDFEAKLDEHMEKLYGIIANPHSLLDKETMKVNIGRAKRISSRSYQYLSHHTEDWEKMTVVSPKPRRILHEELTIDFTVYENRLFKVFLHEAIKHLNKRIKETADLNKFFLSIFDPKEFMDVWSDKIDRSNALVGRAQKTDKSKNSSNTNSTLLTLRSQLVKMEHSQLFEDFPKRSINKIVYHDTNVLNSHKYYKYLKILWLELKNNKENSEDKDIISFQQDIMTNMRKYVLSLFVYSLKNLGYVMSKDKGIIYAKHTVLPSFELKPDKYGVLMIKTGQVKVSVITLGGIYKLDQVKLPDNSVCFCFKDFQETKENVYKNIYFVNPIDTYSIECSGLVLRKQILKVYQTVINKRVDYKHSLRDYTSAIVNSEIIFDKKAFKFSFSDRIPEEVDEKEVIANLKEMPSFKKRNKRDQDSLVSDMEELVSEVNNTREEIKKTLICPKCFKQYRSQDIKYLVCDCGFVCDLTTDDAKFYHQHKSDLYKNIISKNWGMDLVE